MVTLAALVYYKVGRYFDIEIRLDRATVEGDTEESMSRKWASETFCGRISS